MDLGTIRLVSNPYERQKDYWFKSADRSKLSNIPDATDGDTALEVDTGDIYCYLCGEWVKLGEESTENTAQTQSVNLSPLNINREELTESNGLNKSELPDSLTVEPITESLTGDKNLNQNEELWGSDSLTVEPINSEELR